MTRTSRRLAVVVAAAVLLGVVAGCDGGTPVAEPPSEAPSASASPPTSPSPSPPAVAKPARPSAVDDDDQAGAEAAAVYFLELDSYMQATGDTTEWAKMSHKTCGFCAARLEQANQIAAAGDSYTGGTTDVSVAETYLQDPATGVWPIDVTVSEDGSVITRSDGSIALKVQPSTYKRHVEIFRRDGEWVVLGVAAPKAG